MYVYKYIYSHHVVDECRLIAYMFCLSSQASCPYLVLHTYSQNFPLLQCIRHMHCTLPNDCHTLTSVAGELGRTRSCHTSSMNVLPSLTFQLTALACLSWF